MKMVFPTAELVAGNGCPTGLSTPFTGAMCRAAMSLVSEYRLDGFDYDGTENDGDWPRGCYYSSDAEGVYLNEHPSGSAMVDAMVICVSGMEPVDTDSPLTLFVGDSDVDYWLSMETLLQPRLPNDVSPVYNVGVAGYMCSDVLPEADDMINTFHPAHVVLVCGENDLADGVSVINAFNNYRTVVNRYVDSGAIVYSFGTKPEPSTTELHSKYRALDAMIFELALEMNGSLVFIDSYDTFEDATGTTMYQDDGLHLSPTGYELWTDLLVMAMEDESIGCGVFKNGVCVRHTDSTTSSPSHSPEIPAPTGNPTTSVSSEYPTPTTSVSSEYPTPTTSVSSEYPTPTTSVSSEYPTAYDDDGNYYADE